MKAAATLALTVAALLSGAAVNAEPVNRNSSASEAYWTWLDNMSFSGDRSMPQGAHVDQSNPLHPNFHATRSGGVEWVGTKAGIAAPAVEQRNPLHPAYRR